jgi:hypothetical protein
MSIRVLDRYAGHYGSMPPAKAARQVDMGIAEWLRADGIEPNRQIGTIRCLRRIKNIPEPPDDPEDKQRQTQVYDGDGVFLGWMGPTAAARVVERGWAAVVGEGTALGRPRAIIIPRIAKHEPVVISELRRIEAMRTIRAVERRDALRQDIIRAVATALMWDDVETLVADGLQSHMYGEGETRAVLADIRTLRRKVAAVELALAPDNEDIRQELAGKLLTGMGCRLPEKAGMREAAEVMRSEGGQGP